jgi:KipI family sensor histidine kinase inhibitor
VTPTVTALGEVALRLSLPGIDAVLTLYDAFRRDPLPGQIDLVPGAESLVVHLERPASAELARVAGARAEAELARSAATGHAGRDADDAESGRVRIDTVRIDTVYQGPDLEHVAALIGLSVEGVVTAHSAALWRVAFGGFAPGFAYLTGGDPRLAVPRRDRPRPDVPSGAVGLADEFSGVYPRPSPGGWQLIGRTDTVLWDPQRDPPALLRPGMSVTFRAVRPSMTLQQAGPATAPAAPQRKLSPRGAERGLAVSRPGLLCLVQDAGRSGHADMGVSRSGAADRGALRRANRAVGNRPDAAALEILLGGAEFEAVGALTIGLSGAPVTVSVAHGRAGTTRAYREVPQPMDRALTLSPGARLRLGRATSGLRSYLAVRGGFDLPAVLGSRCTDLLSGLGPEPIRAGDVLPIGDPPALAASAGTEVAPMDADPAGDPGDADAARPLAVLPGPQRDWFADAAWQMLAAESWEVTSATNRVAARLAGPRLPRDITGELASQGLVRGAIQVPPSGELVAFLADHPVTGGYPVIAVLTEAAADRLAQCRPGATVRFRTVSAAAGA